MTWADDEPLETFDEILSDPWWSKYSDSYKVALYLLSRLRRAEHERDVYREAWEALHSEEEGSGPDRYWNAENAVRAMRKEAGK